MGYSTDFYGEWTVTPPLTPEGVAYLTAFANTRRVKRNAAIVENMYDPIRAAAGIGVGPEGGYYVSGEGFKGQAADQSILDGNVPPKDQPSLWCQWVPTPDGKTIVWDGGEKFYNYVEWIEYLINSFLLPWGHVLDGTMEWQGEDSDDRGAIRITNNVVEIGYGIPGYRFNTLTKGNNTLATKTPTITATVSAPVPAGGTALPAAVPAAVLSRKAKPTATTPAKNVHNFAAWKDAISTAQSAAGYEHTSPIYGKTDIEVLTRLKPALKDLIDLAGQEIPAGAYTFLATGEHIDASSAYGAAVDALNQIDELLKRKIAKQIAGQTYKGRKTI